uniref:RNase III domain-containing protein n=1 Tax=Pseudo-nitzschia delicatissima TaxID=44447 RepID=A0A6T9ZTV0_9STRA|mmetsp:Transcript_998/g.2319  ORF Transcript_998/g.2319 Transcript_998/m.2319 type:complete len:219 (+) Transcript_998:139-795(+)
MVKRSRCCYFHVFTGIIGSLFLGSLGCDSFPLVPAFVDDRRIFRQSIPLPRSSIDSQRGVGVGSAIALSDDGDDGDAKSLLEFLSPMTSCKVNQMSGTDLAYVGDVVFELFVRSRHVWPSKRTSDLQNTVVGLVRAEHQSHLLQQLKESFPLSEKENQVLMRGRNAVTKSKNRRNPAAYQDSTAFEALIGYIYITDKDRCRELLAWLESVVDIREEGN